MTARRPAVVVLRALGLGDFLTAVPAYRALRRHCPDHEIVLAAPGSLAPLAGWTGAIDRVLPTGALQPVRWSGPAAGLAVNLHGRGPQSHRLLAAVPAGRRIGFRCMEVPGFDGPAWQQGEHEVRRWCRLLAAVGIPCDPTDLLLTPPLPRGPAAGPTGPPVVVVHPGAAAPARRWPATRFAPVGQAAGRRRAGRPDRSGGAGPGGGRCGAGRLRRHRRRAPGHRDRDPVGAAVRADAAGRMGPGAGPGPARGAVVGPRR